MRHRQLVSSKRKRSRDEDAAAASGGDGQATTRAKGGVEAEPSGEPLAEGEEAHAAAAAEAARRESGGVGPVETDDLREFSRMLAMFTQSSKLKVYPRLVLIQRHELMR